MFLPAKTEKRHADDGGGGGDGKAKQATVTNNE
jgi:hypothetical protein